MADWTRDMVEDRVVEAAAVLRHMPPPRVAGYFSTWPEVVRSFGDLVGQEPRPMKITPTARDISRMEETLTWTAGLDPIDGKIVWLRAYGLRWKRICWTVGLQRSAAHQHWLYALCVIAFRLNGRRYNRNLSMQRVIDLARADDIAA